MKNPFQKSAKAALEAAERHELTMREALEAATESMVAAAETRFAAVEAPDAELDRLDLAVQRAQIAQQRAMERHKAACNRVTEADAALEVEEAADRAKKAKALRAKVEPRIGELYAEASRAILTAILGIARADAELKTLEVRAEGQGFSSVEVTARSRTWLREKVVATKRVALWTDRHGNPLEEQPKDHLVLQDQDEFYMAIKVADGGRRFDLQRREFDSIEFLEDCLGRG